MRVDPTLPKPDWSALETAFEHNAPETHSYLDLETGQVVTIVDSRPEDEDKRQQIRRFPGRFVHLDPASSREQYRWMERFVASVEDKALRDRLVLAIDGKGAFRRFKDVLLSYPVERDRWFSYRANLLHIYIDGWLAKRYRWQSQLGGWLDPLADKALVLSVCIALTAHGDLPYWLLGLIAIRDLVIVSGAVAFHFNYAPLHAAPTIVGKITTAALLLLVVLLLWQNVNAQIPSWLVETLTLACAGLLLVSGVDYVRRWSVKARRIGDRHP